MKSFYTLKIMHCLADSIICCPVSRSVASAFNGIRMDFNSVASPNVPGRCRPGAGSSRAGQLGWQGRDARRWCAGFERGARPDPAQWAPRCVDCGFRKTRRGIQGTPRPLLPPMERSHSFVLRSGRKGWGNPGIETKNRSRSFDSCRPPRRAPVAQDDGLEVGGVLDTQP